MLPEPVAAAVRTYLDRVDVALPGRVEGFYVVGSVALGAFRPGRSDVDFLAVVAGGLEPPEIEALRRTQRSLYQRELVRSLGRLRWPLVCNGCFVDWGDFARSPTTVVPSASHVSREFSAGEGFDVNPVTWRILAERGIAVRGPDVATLEVHEDADQLRQWNIDNLNEYWRSWADAVRRPGRVAVRASFQHLAAAWGALGAPRLHYTICTGEIASKEQAGEYALDVFDRRWHPVLEDALAYWRGSGGAFSPTSPRRRHEVADFVTMVVDAANALEPST